MLNTSSKGEASNAPPSVPLDQSILTAAKGGGIKFFGISFAYVTRFALGIVMARFMGAEQYGLYSLGDTAFYVIIGLAMLGLVPALVRYIPIFASRRDETSLWGTLQVGLGTPFVVSVLAGACLLVFASPFAELIFHEPRLVPVLWVVALALPFGTLISATAAAIRGLNRIQYSVIAEDIFFPLIKLMIVMALVITGLNAVKVMTAHAIGAVVCSVMLLYFLHKLFPLNRPWSAARRDVKEIFRFSMPLYGSALISLFGGNLQTLLLGALNAVVSVGIFTAAIRVNQVGRMFHHAISVAAQPIVSDLYSKEEHRQLGHFYQSMTKWTFTFTLPLFLVILFFSKPILSIFGSDFVAGSTGLIILSCGGLINAGTGISGQMITMTGKTWLNTVNTILSLTLRIVLSLLLIPRFDVVGAAIAMAGAESVLSLVRTLEVFVLFRLLPYNKSFIKPIIAGIITLAATCTIAHWVSIGTSIASTAINLSFLLATYAVMILFLGLSEEDRMILVRLHRRIKAVLPG